MKVYSEREINLADAQELGLSKDEFLQIRKILKRKPSLTEIGIFAALWSEHCCYKNSILLLKTFPTDSERSLVPTGQENAGVLDIGDQWAIVFKMESHNHPTAISPYHGAATAIGGIMRDIFSMGARPICSMNFLCFAPLSKKSSGNQRLFTQAVAGISDYGNSLGIPVVGGHTIFDDSYRRNCLVNAFALGIVKHQDLMRKRSRQSEGLVYIVGSPTGRDGVHGASFASANLNVDSEQRKAQVQIGDPFTEKLLMEATLEALQTGEIISLQDMGAAGLSCCAAELSAENEVGMDLNLDLVPLREKNMSAFDIMLSESQERMLMIIDKNHQGKVCKIFDKWELAYACIGELTADQALTIRQQNRIVAQIPAKPLVLGGGAPQYQRESKMPADLPDKQKLNLANFTDLPESKIADFLRSFIAQPNLASRRPIYQQYDSDVGLVKLLGPGSRSGILRIPDSNVKIAISLECKPRAIALNPYEGTCQSVFAAARQLVTVGAQPIGITNCLNFADPYQPENYYFLTEGVRGIRDSCLALKIPVTGGNVSLFNQSEKGPILPTPAIGMVGIITEQTIVSNCFCQKQQSDIFLLGHFSPKLDGSEYLNFQHRSNRGMPKINTAQEIQLQALLFALIREDVLLSISDIGRGGLAVALFHAGYNEVNGKSIGFRLADKEIKKLLQRTKRYDQLFFGETDGCVFVSLTKKNRTSFEKICERLAVPHRYIGETTQQENIFDYGVFKLPAQQMIDCYEQGLVERLNF